MQLIFLEIFFLSNPKSLFSEQHNSFLGSGGLPSASSSFSRLAFHFAIFMAESPIPSLNPWQEFKSTSIKIEEHGPMTFQAPVVPPPILSSWISVSPRLSFWEKAPSCRQLFLHHFLGSFPSIGKLKQHLVLLSSFSLSFCLLFLYVNKIFASHPHRKFFFHKGQDFYIHLHTPA